MNPTGPNLPNQLLPYSIGYVSGKVTIVTMHATDGRQYLFQAIENGRYAVMYHDADSILMKATSISEKEAPAALRRIFEAKTLEKILELQASRQLIECVHRTLD